jgi:alkylated DNA nucleotide flippase Atl1
MPNQLDFRTLMPFTSWTDEALEEIRLMADGQVFSAEDIRTQIGSPETPNQMGAVFRTAMRQGLIQSVAVLISTRATRHGGLVRQWERTSHGSDGLGKE